MAKALLSVRDYEQALAAARKAIYDRSDRPNSHLLLAIALGHLDRKEEARAALEECERLRPGFVAKWEPGFKNPADNEHFLIGLRKAGWRA